MTLIQNNKATEQLNASSKNLDALLNLKARPKREEVVTQVALASLEEIKKSRSGWGHSIKKFFATTITYTSALAAPVAALIATVFLSRDRIQNLDPSTLTVGGSVLGGLLATDFALGKLFGVRPLTACTIIAYDAYREWAKTLSNGVENGCVAHEEKMKKIGDECRKILVDELKGAYLGIAEASNKRQISDIEKLVKLLPNIQKALSQMGLSKLEVSQILSPLESVLKLRMHYKFD